MPGIFDTAGAPILPDTFEPESDPYGFTGKNYNYPKGQFTTFRDGRLLRDCDFRAEWGRLPVAGVGTTFVTTPAYTIPNDRAVFIPRIYMVSLADTTVDIDGRWQLWIDGRFIYGGINTIKSSEVNVYAPPRSTVTVFYRFVNNLALGIFFTYAFHYIEFNSGNDIWKWGTGGAIPNPAIGALIWP